MNGDVDMTIKKIINVDSNPIKMNGDIDMNDKKITNISNN